jgi:hypothetical protein
MRRDIFRPLKRTASNLEDLESPGGYGYPQCRGAAPASPLRRAVTARTAMKHASQPGGLYFTAQLFRRHAAKKSLGLKRAGVETLVSCDTGCLLHLAGRLQRLGESVRVMHLAELLNASTSREEGHDAPGN